MQPIKVLSVFGTRPEAVKMAGTKNPFGDGNASERITNAVRYYFKQLDIRPEEYM